jgi:hypothetical protein
VQTAAINLATLYTEIYLGVADEFLPDRESYTAGDMYRHPDLRLNALVSTTRYLQQESPEQRLLSYAVIQNELAPLTNDPEEGLLILHRIVDQIRLALSVDAVLIVGDQVASLVRQVFQQIRGDLHLQAPELHDVHRLVVEQSELRAMGLTWQCPDLDEFAAIRMSSEITTYADGFRSALESVQDTPQRLEKMKELMREAMSREAIARRANGAFETVGMVTDIIGAALDSIPNEMLPGAVPLFNDLVSLGSQMTSGQIKRIEARHKWYLLGPKIHQLSLQDALKRSVMPPEH